MVRGSLIPGFFLKNFPVRRAQNIILLSPFLIANTFLSSIKYVTHAFYDSSRTRAVIPAGRSAIQMDTEIKMNNSGFIKAGYLHDRQSAQQRRLRKLQGVVCGFTFVPVRFSKKFGASYCAATDIT